MGSHPVEGRQEPGTSVNFREWDVVRTERLLGKRRPEDPERTATLYSLRTETRSPERKWISRYLRRSSSKLRPFLCSTQVNHSKGDSRSTNQSLEQTQKIFNQMRAVLSIISSDSVLMDSVLPYINFKNEVVDWEQIFASLLSSSHSGSCQRAHSN